MDADDGPSRDAAEQYLSELANLVTRVSAAAAELDVPADAWPIQWGGLLKAAESGDWDLP